MYTTKSCQIYTFSSQNYPHQWVYKFVNIHNCYSNPVNIHSYCSYVYDFLPLFFFFFLNSLSDLGLSTGTHNWPTRCNRPIHTWKPANSTPMMVGSRFQPPTTETSGSVDESTLQNPIQIDPTGLYIGNTPIFTGMKNFLSFIARYVEIRQDLDRSGQISSKSLIDLVSSFRNLARSSHMLARSGRFWPVLLRFRPFLICFGYFLLPRVWPTPTNILLAQTSLSYRSMMGLDFEDLKWLGRILVGHKPNSS